MTQKEQDEILIHYQSWEEATGPKTDDELHAWIVETFGHNIPRTAVCGDLGHCAPFEFLADVYFERCLSALVMANRGGSKTYLAAMWHLLNSKFKKKCEGMSVGAILEQAGRAYDNLRALLCMQGKCDTPDDNPDITKSLMSETLWRNGSKVEIVPGTESAVNGPHPQKVHFDEVELAKPKVFQESRNMSQSRHGHKAQDIVTSTRKGAYGPMQKLLDEIRQAELAGLEPPYRLYTWCIFECAENQPNCQAANPDLPEDQRCNCHRVVKGQWESGEPRTFKDVCRGRLARSEGWIPLHDIHKTFRTTNRDVWEAQQECAKPSTHGLVLPSFKVEEHGIRWYSPDPALGPIYMGVDWGSTNPNAILWVQVLQHDTLVYGFHQTKSEEPKKLLTAGTRVVFDEVYIAEIGPAELATHAIRHSKAWQRLFPKWKVFRIFADVQGKGAILDWARIDSQGTTLSGKLVGSNFATKDVKLQVNYMRELVEDNLYAVDVSRCKMHVEELEAWHYPEKDDRFVDDPEKPVEDFDHTISAMRYLVANVRAMERRGGIPKQTTPSTGQVGFGGPTITGSGPSRYLPREGGGRYHEMF